MMIVCAIFIAIGIIATIITGVMIDGKANPKPPLILSFYLSVIIGLSAIVSFIVGHFTGV